MVRSRRFAAVCVAAKCAQVGLLPYSQHPVLSVFLALLATYHVGFALTYQWSLSIIARSRRGAEDLRQKVLDRTVSPGDVLVWGGLLFRATNWFAGDRAFRRECEVHRAWWFPWLPHEVLVMWWTF